MRFRDREKSLNAICAEVENEVQYWSQRYTNQPINEALAQVIAVAVTTGIRKALEEQYTDEDFEKDIGLKS